MAIELNVAHRNAIVAASAAAFNDGTLSVRNAAPAGADNAATGTELAAITLPSAAFGAPNAGAVTGNFQGTVSATGEPKSFRLISQDSTQVREGDAGAEGSGATMIISDLVDGDLIEGGTLTVTYTITQPASAA